MNMNVDEYENKLNWRIMNIAPNKCCSLIPTVSAYFLENSYHDHSTLVRFSQVQLGN